MLDNRKPGIIAKVCGQVVEYYKQALKQLEFSTAKEAENHLDSFFDVVGTKQSRYWRAYLEFKISYYVCLSYLHMGMASEETGRWGERVAYYDAAVTNLGIAVRANKEYKVETLFNGVTDALVYTNDVVNGKLEISKKENEFIYHEKVPDVESLPSIKGASLVKGIPFDEQDLEVSGGDLFSRIVTLETHAASSLYSEELAKILRTVGGEIEVANDSLVMYLSSLQLEDIPDTDSLALASMPQEIVDCVAGLSVRPQCVPQLQQAMAKLAGVSADVEASLQEIQHMLKEEERAEEEFVKALGPRPRPIMSELERETQKYHAAHSMASESNLTLHEAMRLHVKNLKLLSQSVDGIKTSVPSLASLDDSTLASLEDMRKIMMKVDEMRNQRRQLEQDLRNAVQEDDITGRIAVQGNADTDKIFVEELKKHDRIIGYIRQNIAAQSAIVQAMSERNAEYADARYKVDSVMRQREEALGQLVASYHAYEDLLNKTTKGLEFYDKLDGNVSKLLDRVKGVVKVQDEERTQILATSEQKAAEARALSLSLISGGGLDPKMNFSPAAPPPDTPENEPNLSFINNPSVNPVQNLASVNLNTTAYNPAIPPAGARPKLSDYLSGGYKASSSPGSPVPPPVAQEPNRRPKLSDFLKARDQKVPGPDNLGVRPAPVGASNPDPPAGSSCGPTPSVSAAQISASVAFQNMHLGNVQTNVGAPSLSPTVGNKDEIIQHQKQYNMQHNYYQMQQQYYNQQYMQNMSKTPSASTSTTYSAPQQPLASAQQQPQQHYMPPIQQQYPQGQQLAPGQYVQQPIQGQPMTDPQLQNKPTEKMHHQPVHQQMQDLTPQQQHIQIPGQQQQHAPYPMPYQKAQPGQQQSQAPHQTPGYQQTHVQGEQQLGDATAVGYTTPQKLSESKKEITQHQNPQGMNQPKSINNPAQFSNQVNPQIQAQYSNYKQQFPQHQYIHQQSGSVNQQQNTVGNSPFQQMFQQFHNPNMHQHTSGSPQRQAGVTNQQALPTQIQQLQFYSQQQQHPTYSNSQNPACYPFPVSQQQQSQQEQLKDPVAASTASLEKTPTQSTGTPVSGSSSNLSLLSEITAPVPTPAVPMPGTVKTLPTIPMSVAPAKIDPPGLTSGLQTIDKTPVGIIISNVDKNTSVPEEYLEKKWQYLEKYLSNMTNKTLEEDWKQIVTQFEQLQKKKLSVSVARCYPYENRAPDVLPFDFNRLVLKDCKDDYINASLVTLPDGKTFVVTQTPLAKSKADFWSLIWHEGIETVVCLATDLEMADGLYLPRDRNTSIREGVFNVTVQSIKTNHHYTERVVNLHHSNLKQTRALLLLQIVGSPGPRNLAEASLAMTELRAQQRFPARPVLVHCTDGGNRSGAYLALTSLTEDIGNLKEDWPDLTRAQAHLLTQRKGIIRDKAMTKIIIEALIEFLIIKMDRDNDDTIIVAEKTSIDVHDLVGISVASLKAELQPETQLSSGASAGLPDHAHDVNVGETYDKPKSPTLTQLDPNITPVTHIPLDLTKLADISISNEDTKTKKFSKEDFNSPSKKIGPMDNSADPLSQLDPLWSLK